MSEQTEIRIDSMLVHQAYAELHELEEGGAYKVDDKFIRSFADKNWSVLEEMQLLAEKMMDEYNNSDQYDEFDPEPVEVFLLSAPQHLKHKLVK